MQDRDNEIPPSWQGPRSNLHYSVLSKILFQRNHVAVLDWNSAIKQNKILLGSELKL